MALNLFPFNTPTYSGKIILPKEDKSYVKDYYNKNYYVESTSLPELDIDPKRLKSGREAEAYSIGELRDFAKVLDVKNFSKLNKKELVNIIKLKLKL